MTAQKLSRPPLDSRPDRHAKLRVHLVDDDQAAADSLAQWMKFHGYETQVSYSGTDALEAAMDFRPDVMLVDILLPGMDGFELAAAVREKDGFQNVVLIAVTGLADEELRTRTKQARFGLFFSKPVDLDLLDAVLAALAKKKLLR